jgi:hypothetical protein
VTLGRRSFMGESAVDAEPAIDLVDQPAPVVAEPRRRRPSWMVVTALAVMDAGGLALCFLIASTFGSVTTAERGTLMLAFGASLPLWLLAFKASGLYAGDSARVNHSTLDEAGGVARVVALCTAAFLVVLWATDAVPERIGLLFAFWAMATVAVPTLRGGGRGPIR